MEEGYDISHQPDALFHHIFQGANDMADGFAKEGVFHDYVSFDE